MGIRNRIIRMELKKRFSLPHAGLLKETW